jgi:hypothetical protein
MIEARDLVKRYGSAMAMPDDARVLFGLAPVHADTLTGHAEISQVFTVQAEANAELRDQAAAATRIDVLAVRALGLIALNDSLLRGPLAARESAVDVRVLLLDPDSPAAAVRAGEIGESPGSFGAGIRLALARLAEFAGHPCVRCAPRCTARCRPGACWSSTARCTCRRLPLPPRGTGPACTSSPRPVTACSTPGSCGNSMTCGAKPARRTGVDRGRAEGQGP